MTGECPRDATSAHIPDAKTPIGGARDEPVAVARYGEPFDSPGVPFEDAVQRSSGMRQRGVAKVERWLARQASRIGQQRVHRLRLATCEPADQLHGELFGIAREPM